MTKDYIGVKKFLAWQENKLVDETTGLMQQGYAVKYENGYVSWSPKEVFEKAYYELSGCEITKLHQSDIDNFIKNVTSTKLGEKTTVVQVELLNGFIITESSSCVDLANYDHELGTKIATDRAKNKIWELLGFVLQTAVNGIK